MKLNSAFLVTLALLLAQAVTAQAGQPADASTASTPEPAAGTAKSSGARKATVPETPKDRENKKKCRGMGGTWQLGHCNVG